MQCFNTLKDYSNRTFLIYGNVRDKFLYPDGCLLNLDYALYDYLKRQLRYESVAFIDNGGLYFWDQDSADKTMLAPSQLSQKQSPKLLKRPKGITTKTKTNPTQEPTRLRYSFMGNPNTLLGEITRLLRNKTNVAVIVYDYNIFLRGSQTSENFTYFKGFMENQLQSMGADNKSILVFVTPDEEERICRDLHLKFSETIPIGLADRDEIETLLSRLRLKDKKEVDIKSKEMFVNFLAVYGRENTMGLNALHAKLLEHSVINMQTIKEATGKQPEPSAEEQIQKLIGMDELKKDLQTLIDSIPKQENQKSEFPARLYNKNKPKQTDYLKHYALLGNPGTGKTTIAKLIGKLYQEKGVLSIGHFIKATRPDLVGQYQGETAIKTKNLIGRAMGGVLFIDEAYSLVQDERDTFGKEAQDTLIEAMSDRRGNFVVILAGYPNKMEKMIAENPGMGSRIQKFHI